MKKRTIIVAFALIALLLVNIAPGYSQDDVTLVVWDTFARDADLDIIEQLNQEFMDANPGVTIIHEGYGHEELNIILPLALSDDSGPDIAQINQGYSAMGPLVEADLLVPLDDYADAYGWWDRYALTLHNRNSLSENGQQFGVGNVYGVSNAAEVVGVFYHRDIFEEQNLSIPTTFAEFEALVAHLAEADITPIVFGSLDGWPAIHNFSAIQHAYTTSEDLDSFMFGLEGGTFATDYNVTAAGKLVEWVESGYFSDGFEGMDYDNQTTGAFLNKDGAGLLQSQ